MKDNNNVYERAKALAVDEHAKTTQGGSVYERAKALATDEGVEESLGDLGARITANAEAYNRALANKNFERAKEDFNKMLEESTLNHKPYATSEDVQMEELNNFMENRANEARMRGVQDYLDQTIGAWGTEKASDAAVDLAGVDAKITTPDALMRSFNNPYSAQTLRDIASQVPDTSFASLPADARSQAEKIADEYIAENPHLAYGRDLYVNYFASQIYDDVFKRKINTDDKFFADAYEAITGKSYKSYKREVDKEAVAKLQGMKRELEAMNETLKKKRDEDRTHIGQSRSLFSSAWNDLRNAFGGNIESIENLIDEIDNVIEGSFTSGFDKGFDFDRMATVGMSGIFTEEEMAEALSKARNGEPLTEEEENYVRIHQYAQELNQLKEVREKYAEQLYDTWLNGIVNFNSIGEGVGTTVEMMPAFAGAMKLTSGIGAFAKIGGMAALKSALEAGGTELFKYGVKTVGKLGYNYGLAKARGLVVAPIMPSTYNTYLESLNSAYSFDDEGNLTYTPVNERQEYFGAVISTANEVSSEYLGAGIESVVGWGARGLGRMVANTRLAGVATVVGKKARKYLPKFTPQAKVAMRALDVLADPVSETLSEALGDIMTSYEQSMIGMDVDKSQYGTMDYWMTLAGVTLAYGGSIAALGATKSYSDVKQAVKQRDKILGNIENRNLYNTLLAVSTSDDIVLASSALADFDWKGNGIEPQDNDYKLAQAFRVADLNVKIMEGMVGENTRLESFRGTIEGVRDIVYQGKAGEYSDMIFEAEVDGKKVYVINGFEKNSNTGQRIVYDPATGEKTSVDASKVKLTRELSVDDYIDEAYANAFSLEMEKERIADIKEKALQMDNPTEKDVQRVASTMSIALPKVGNTVMLANGNMGEVTEVLSPAEFVVRDVAGTTYKVHFTDILSTDKLTATAQGAMARGEASTPISPANEAAAPTEATEATETTPEANDENGIAMGAEVTIDGRVGKVRARTQDGRYAVAFEAESGNYEDAEIEFFTGEELASLMGIIPAPTAEAAHPTETTTEVAATEDGSVDIEQMSAEDAAKVLIQRAGTIEEAIAQVKQVIETVTEERKKTAKAEKKASLNDIGKKSAELQALDTRLEFYGEVLGVLEVMLAEQQKQTMEAAQRVAEEAGVAAETPTPNEDATTTEDKQGAEAKPIVGLIRNGAEMKFTDKVIEMVDFVAKRLGLTVEFVDDLKNEAGQKINGDIKGKHVRLSTKGDRGVKFIVGHEFFHRIKDNIDETTYNKYIGALKEFFGEERWEEALNAQKSKYRAHNVAVAKKSMEGMTPEEVATIAKQLGANIEGLSAEDAKAAVARAAMRKAEQGDEVARALFPTMLTYSDALMLEETAADISGEMVANLDAFSNFVEDNKSEYAIIRGMHKALRYIHDMFASFGQTTRQRKVKRLVKNLESIMAEAVKNERANIEKARKDANTPVDNKVETTDKGDVEAVTNEKTGQGKFSLSTYREGGRGALADFLDARVAENALTPNEAAEMMQQMDDIYEACTTMADKYEPFGQWSEAKVVEDKDGNPVFSVIKANGDYAMNLDFSLVCKKRRTLDAVLNNMVKRGMIKSVSQKDTTVAKINEVIRKYGFETACALCFVDARRFQVIKTARQFCDLYNDMVDLLIPKKSNIAVNEFNFANRADVVVAENGLETMSDDALNIEAVRKIGYKAEGKKKDGSDKYGMSVMAKIARHLVEHPEDRKHLSPSDFISTAGFDRVKEQKPAILSLYNAKKGTGGPKAAFSDVQYLNDIIRSNWKVDEAYAVGGVRLQSFSDYVPRMVFDYIQMVAELAAKKLPVHAYTKEALFAKTFGLTGMKINLSLVPDVVEGGVAAGLDAEGNYVWKQGETFPYEEAIALQNAEGYRENCGTIAVGVSDAHILKMLDDDNIRMVIPYHKSGLPKQVAKMNNVAAFTDYTNVQNTTKDGKAITKEEAKEVPNYNELLREHKDARKAAQAYVDWCTERGYTPKFAKFANHPNYYKLLEDFTTMVDGKYAPQEAVTFTFPTEESAFGSLESLIEQGLEEDAVLEGQRDVKVDAIVEEVGEVLGVQPKFSLATDVASILEEYDTEGVKYGSIIDVADGIEGLIAESTEDTTELENILNDFRAAQDDARRWGNRMDSGGEKEFEEALRAYASQGQPKFSLSEETTQIFDAAKAKFGTTNDMREAGYILPDGSMLDFSGRHQVEGDASFLNGDRTVDHREISDIAYDADDNETGINTDLGDFLDRGAIRIDSNAGAINLNVAPTKAQKDRLKRLIERNDGYVYIDFGKGWDTEHYAEYEAARASRVLGDIDRYFDEGIKPTGNVRFSLQETNDRFNAELDAFKAGTHKGLLHLGYPSEILKVCGVGARELTISPRELSRHLKKHNLTTDDIKDLVYAIQEPIMVYKHGKKHPNIVVITEVMVNNGKLSVSIELDDKGNVVEISNISSVHSKDALTELDRLSELSDEELKKALKWVDKEKVSGWLMPTPYMGSGASLDPKHLSTANIIQNFQNPKIEPRNSLITPEMDAAYIDAVNNGDMATAQRMVMEAAERAGYTIRAYHGTPNKVYNPDWQDAVAEIVTILFPNEGEINMDAEYGTDEYRKAWDLAAEIRYNYREYREKLPKTLQRRFERGITKPFTVFDTEKMGSSTGARDANNGFFFSPNPLFASSFRATFAKDPLTGVMSKTSSGDGVLYDVFIKPNNLLDLRSLPATKSKAKQMGNTDGYDVVINKVKDGRNRNKVEEEIMVKDPTLIKSADPVTYDDAGNVIPLSERFNPKKEDIRYSISSDEDILFEKKTTFLTDLVREYNIPLPTFIAQTKEEFVRMVQDNFDLTDDEVEANRAEIERMEGAYVPEDEIVLINGGAIRGREQMSGCVRHEFGHYITKKHLLNDIRQAANTLGEDALKRAQQEFLQGYSYEKLGAEGVVNELVSYLSETPTIQEIMSIFEGNLEVDEFIGKLQTQLEARNDLKEKAVYIALLPLAKKNIELQKKQYGAEKENIIVISRKDSSGRGNSKSEGGSSPSYSKGFSGTQARSAAYDRRSEGTDAQEVTRFMLPDPDPSEVFYDEMPLYDEQGNEIDFNSLTPEEAKTVLDDKVRQMLEAEYDHNVSTIRNEAREARAVVNEAYREAKSKRRKGEKAARTNAARIDEIFGDTPFESLPYEVQALILIATGEAKIYWVDKGNKRGLASELGLKGSTGDRHAYRNIWGGAKKSFDEVVHSWWESIGGYESGVDTNDLRNALISALQSVQSSKDAMQEIINKYDDLATDRDNALAEVDRNEEKELHEAKSAYEQHLATFELAEGEERAAYHDRAAQFFGNQSLSRVEDILEDLAGEIERNKRKIERLKAKNKDVYNTLAEGINKSKEVVLRALERLRMFAGMEEVDLNDVARLINLVKTARSQRQINNLSAQATALVQRVSIKKAKTNLMRLLSLKLSNTDIIHKMLKESDTWTKEEREAILKHLWKVSRNGLRVSKAVHKDTKEIFDALAEQVKAFKKETKNMKGADLAAKIQSKLAELEKELHPEVVYDSEGNVQDNANLPTDFNAENKHLSKLIFKSYLEMATKEAAYHEASATLREKINNGENTAEANANVVVTRENYLHALTEFNSTLEHLIVKGKDELRDWNAQKEKHEIEIRSMGIRAIGGKKASGQGKASSKMARARARINTTVNAPYWTFETVLEKIDHNSPYKKGKLYTYFMDMWADANDDLINRYAAHMEEIAEVMRKCFPDDAKNILRMKRNPYALYQYIMRKAESTPIGTLTYKEMGEEGQMRDAQIVLNVANAMNVIAMWRQPRYQEAMQEKHGITQGDIDALMANIASLNAGFLDFMDWVNDTFLPSTRLEYDVVYRKMNGGSMPKEINYFPARVAGHKEVDLANIDNGELPTTPSALKDRMSAHIMPQLGMDYFKVLESHIQDMDNWAAYAELTADLNVLLSSDEFRRRCNDYMGGLGGDGGGKGSLYDLFKQTSLIATGMYRGDAGMETLRGQLQKAWATSNIAFRGWTAVKQISSITTGMFDNWTFYRHAGIAATGIGIYHEIKNAMEISPSLRYRWKSGAAGMEALARETQREDGYTVQRGAYEKGKDFIGDAIKTLVRAGMTPNAAVDLLACSIIVNSVYETEIARLTGGKREATEEEKRAAVRKAEHAFNTTQQSSEGAYLAPVQANPAYGVLTTYMNASFALHRKRMGGIKELWKLATSKEYRRYLKDEFGVDAAKISAIDAFKDIISGLAGELGFAAMGWGLMAFMSTVNGWLNEDDDDEDVAAAKQEFLDSSWQFLLNGYLGGSAASGIFNGFDMSLTPAYEELAKDVKGVFDDNGNRVWEVAQMAAKYGVGVDLKALQNIGAGLENMFLEEKDEYAGAVLKFLNAPNRYIKAFVGDRREGETLEEYQTRIIRFNTLFEDVVYEHYFDKKGNYIGENAPSLTMSKKQAKELRKEYEAAYAKNIIYSNGGSDAYQKYMKTNEGHAKICELLGWSTTTKPSKEKRYVSDMHAELALYQNNVAYWTKARENWIGSEDGYYDLLMKEQKAKNDLINNYYEYIKQTGIGAY